MEALQFEHLIVGKKLDERVKESMMTASSLPCSSQPKGSDPKVRTCSNAAIRIYSAFTLNFVSHKTRCCKQQKGSVRALKYTINTIDADVHKLYRRPLIRPLPPSEMRLFFTPLIRATQGLDKDLCKVIDHDN